MRFYKIIIGDSRDMREVESSSVHLAVTSPPYWHLDVFSEVGEPGWDRDLSRIERKEDFFRELGKVWKEVERVLVPGGVLVVEWEDYPPGSRIYGYIREICLCGDMVASVEKAGLYLISRWIWRKFNSGTAINKFQYTTYGNLRQNVPRAIANWAYVFAFQKRCYESKERELDFTREEWKAWSDGVWYIESKSSGAGEYISGGAVFPVELVKRIIRIYTVPGQVVLDPFLGTGTTMLAAFQLGRSCIGYEVLPRMLPVIKAKVKYGSQSLEERIKWEIIRR